MSDSEFLTLVYQCTRYKAKDWRKLLELVESDKVDLLDKGRLSWVWPSIENLEQLGALFKLFKIKMVLSIGCGCGLLEWILKRSTGVSFYGLEKDRSWWESHYAIKGFIRRSYIDDLKPTALPETFMQSCCDIHEKKNWNFALMFCYFNSREAFLNYLQMYKGEWVIIVGPLPEVDIHTDPTPFTPNFPDESQWKMCENMLIGENNVIAIYKKQRIQQNTT